MIFEKYLSSLLDSKFGSMLDGLDPKNVNISIWNGSIEYRNLSLKLDYVNGILRRKRRSRTETAVGISRNDIELEFGRVGTLIIQVPWNVLKATSSSSFSDKSDHKSDAELENDCEFGTECSIVIRDISVLFKNHREQVKSSASKEDAESSLTDEEYDTSQPSEWSQEDIEREVLELLEKGAHKKWSLDKKSGDTKAGALRKSSGSQSQVKDSWKDMYLKRVSANILTKLRVSVENVHVRFQHDKESSALSTRATNTYGRGRSFAMGMRLEKFTLYTVDGKKGTRVNATSAEEEGAGSTDISPEAAGRPESVSEVGRPENPTIVDSVFALSDDLDHGDAGANLISQHSNDGNAVHKCARIGQLSIYWDSNCNTSHRDWMDLALYGRNSPTAVTGSRGLPKPHGGGDGDRRVTPLKIDLTNYYEHCFAIFVENEHDHFYLLHPFGCTLNVRVQNPLVRPQHATQKNTEYAKPTASTSSDDRFPFANISNVGSYYSASHQTSLQSNTRQDEEHPLNEASLVIRKCHLSVSRDTLSDFALLRQSADIPPQANTDFGKSRKRNARRVERNKHEKCSMLFECDTRLLNQRCFLESSFRQNHNDVFGPRPCERPCERPSKTKLNLTAWWKFMLFQLCVASRSTKDATDRSKERNPQRRPMHKNMRDNWFYVTLLLKQRQHYSSLYCEWKKSGKKNEGLLSQLNKLERNLCLMYREVAYWRLHSDLEETVDRDEPKDSVKSGSTFTKSEDEGWARYSRRFARETLVGILAWQQREGRNVRSEDTNANANEFPMPYSIQTEGVSDITVDEIVSTVISGDSEIDFTNRISSSLGLQDLVDCESSINVIEWKFTIGLSSLELKCLDTLSLTNTATSSTMKSLLSPPSTTLLPILKFNTGLEAKFMLFRDTKLWDFSCAVDRLEVEDLMTSGTSYESGDINQVRHPRLFRLTNRETCDNVVLGCGGKCNCMIEVVVQKQSCDDGKSPSKLCVNVDIPPTVLNYRINALEAFSRMIMALRMENEQADKDMFHMKNAMKSFSKRQKAKLKSSILRWPTSKADRMNDDSASYLHHFCTDDTEGRPLVVEGLASSSDASIKLVVDVTIACARIRISKRGEGEKSIGIDLGTITLKHGCEESTPPSDSQEWLVNIVGLEVTYARSDVILPTSIFISMAAAPDTGQHPHQKSVLLQVSAPSLAVDLPSSFLRFTTALQKEWKSRRRYWTLRHDVQAFPAHKKRDCVQFDSTSVFSSRSMSLRQSTADSAKDSSASFLSANYLDCMDSGLSLDNFFIEPGSSSGQHVETEAFSMEKDQTTTNISVSIANIKVHVINDCDCEEREAEATGIVMVDLDSTNINVDMLAGRILRWTCSIKDLFVEDLYQQFYDGAFVGLDHAPQRSFLLSRGKRTNENGRRTGENCHETSTFVSIQFQPGDDAPTILRQSSEELSDSGRNRIAFSLLHPLVVNWNPETIAKLQSTVRSSNKEVASVSPANARSRDAGRLDRDPASEVSESDEDFFDALDELSLSSFSDEEDNVATSFAQYPDLETSTDQTSDGAFKRGPPTLLAIKLHRTTINFRKPPNEFVPYSSLFVIFRADSVTVNQSAKQEGGMRLSCDMKNFSISDACGKRPQSLSKTRARAESSSYHTLYGEIFGARSTESPTSNTGSVGNSFSFQYENFPRTNGGSSSDYVSLVSKGDNGIKRGVLAVKGFDSSIALRLPDNMRLVYIQQLWMELLDYFFEGILAGEVLTGRLRNLPPDFLLGKAEAQTAEQKKGNILFPETLFMSLIVSAINPCIILPVAHQSPQHLIMQCQKLEVSNSYQSDFIQRRSLGDFDWLQWFNQFNVRLKGLDLYSWREEKISGASLDDKIHLELLAKWPVGPTAPLLSPKWNINVKLEPENSFVDKSGKDGSSIVLNLPKQDFAMVMHILTHNIGQPSRNLEAWKKWKSRNDSEASKLSSFLTQQRIVNFGYDIKDSTPATYNVELIAPHLTVKLLGSFEGEEGKWKSSKDSFAHIVCQGLSFEMRKSADFAGRMKVAFNSIRLMLVRDTVSSSHDLRVNSYGMIDILAPLGVLHVGGHDPTVIPQFLYCSTSNAHGDNVKKIQLSPNCAIDISVPQRWLQTKIFFTGLPLPDLWTSSKILGSMQIGERWYAIDHGSESPAPHQAQNAASLPDVMVAYIDPAGTGSKTSVYQFQVHLDSPLLLAGLTCLDSENNMTSRNVALRTHLKYIYESQSSSAVPGSESTGRFSLAASHTLTVDNLCLFTNYGLDQSGWQSTSLPLLHSSSNDPVIEEWRFVAQAKSSDFFSSRTEKKTLVAETLSGAVRYSDLSVLLEVGNTVSSAKRSDSNTNQDDASIDNEGTGDHFRGQRSTASVLIAGLAVVIIDDSHRHFSGIEELLELNSRGFRFSSSLEGISGQNMILKTKQKDVAFSLASLESIDRLQPKDSVFRYICNTAISELGPHSPLSVHRPTPEDAIWGINDAVFHQFGLSFVASMGGWVYDTEVLESVFALAGSSRYAPDDCFVNMHSRTQEGADASIEVCVSPLVLQWNPGTVIAMQRFLGRAHKEFKSRFDQRQSKTSEASKTPLLEPAETSSQQNVNHARDGRIQPVNASILLKGISVFFNKELQKRRLAEASVSGISVTYTLESSGQLDVEGCVDDICFFDPQSYTATDEDAPCEANLKLVSVGTGSTCAMASPTGKKTSAPVEVPPPPTSFLSFRFQKFHIGDEASFNESEHIAYARAISELPAWVLKRAGSVRDYLSVSLSSLVLVHVSARTSELVDYLSNGLPGKGMGKTAEAAKGFLGARIKTRSAMSISIEAPIIHLPRHVLSRSGVKLRIGDVRVESWFEERTMNSALKLGIQLESACSGGAARHESVFLQSGGGGENKFHSSSAKGLEPKDWWRCLSISVLNMGYSSEIVTRGDKFVFSSTSKEITDLHAILRKPLWFSSRTIIRAALSDIKTKLYYTDWSLFWSVYKENIGVKIDKSEWDELNSGELDQDGSFGGEGSGPARESPLVSNKEGHATSIQYAEDARIIRYGDKKNEAKRTGTVERQAPTFAGEEAISPRKQPSPSLDFKFELGVFDLTLHRNDDEGSIIGGCLPFDSSRFRVRRVEASVMNTGGGDQSAEVSLFKLDWTDLGAHERVKRTMHFMQHSPDEIGKGKQAHETKPAVFDVIAEGYSQSNGDSKIPLRSEEPHAPQLVLSVDKQIPSAPSVRVVVNFLSVNALVKPIMETVQFFSCAWHVTELNDIALLSYSSCRSSPQAPIQRSVTDADDTLPDVHLNESKIGTGLNLKIVLHYPRIFLLADEREKASRALVLRGLAIVEYSVLHDDVSDRFFLDGHSKDLSSTSWRDVRTVTSLNIQLHSVESYINPNVGDTLLLGSRATRSSNHNGISKLGVALIEPVTASFSATRTQRSLFPSVQSISLNMAPVSLIVSFGDISLIEKLLKRWSAERERLHSAIKTDEGRHPHALEQDRIAKFTVETSEEPSQGRLNMHNNRSWDSDCSIEENTLYADSLLHGDEGTARLEGAAEYSVSFHAAKLGLVLRKIKGHIVVDDVRFSDESAQVGIGDALTKIGEERVTSAMAFQSAVNKLERHPRPLTLTFVRARSTTQQPVKSHATRYHSPPPARVSIRQHVERPPSPLSPHEQLFYGEKVSSILSVMSADSSNGVEVPYIPMDTQTPDTHTATGRILPADAYTLTFVTGESTGLRYESGLFGGVTVITGVKENIFSWSTRKKQEEKQKTAPEWEWEDFEKDDQQNARLGDNIFGSSSLAQETLEGMRHVHVPRPGAVLLAVNGTSVVDKAHEENLETLRKLSSNSNDENLPFSSKSFRRSVSPQPPRKCVSRTLYQLTFLEATSSEWCTLDSIDVAVDGIALTVIDDINGKDMPLVRGSLEYLEFFLEKGFALPTSMIAVAPPSLLTLDCLQHENSTRALSPQAFQAPPFQKDGHSLVLKKSDPTEIISKISITGRTGIDYYNARIALWEPLLETCSLHFRLEKQSGNSDIFPCRPGHLSIMASDGTDKKEAKSKMFWSTLSGPPISTSGKDMIAGCICVNVTDAASEMMIRAATEWGRWRKSTGSSRESRHGGFTEGGNAGAVVTESESVQKLSTQIGRKPKAAQEAARAVLEIAKKKKDETSGTGSNPFVLRNKTGVRIAFVCQLDRKLEPAPKLTGMEGFSNLESYAAQDIKIAENGSEVRFSIEDEVHETSISSSSLRVRTYDRKHPFLRIVLDESVGQAEPLCDLPVVKIGKSFRPIKIVKDRLEQTVVALWTVQLENNRRVLTLSSSICVEYDGCGTPLEVGVKTKDALLMLFPRPESLGRSDIIPVGVTRASEPCFLPIWVNLCEGAAVHVRPAARAFEPNNAGLGSDLFDWSDDFVVDRGINGTESRGQVAWGNSKKGKVLSRRNGRFTVVCRANDNDLLPVYLTCAIEAGAAGSDATAADDRLGTGEKEGDKERIFPSYDVEASLIAIRVSSCMTVRNLLPVDLEWEVFACGKWGDGAMHHIDGSTKRGLQRNKFGVVPFSDIEARHPVASVEDEDIQKCKLISGQGAEVYSFDFESVVALARFRVDGCGGEWTEWAKIAFPPLTDTERKQISKEIKEDEGKREDLKEIPVYRTRHTLTVMCRDGSGAPLRLGIKLQAKNSLSSYYDKEAPYGFDIILFSELWIKNLTPLPLVVGAPTSQVNGADALKSGEATSRSLDVAGKLAAETALMEIVSVLELGDRGRDINVQEDLTNITGELFVLPLNEADTVCEEVFEYIEVEHSCVKRRWWASEKHDCVRKRPALIGLPDRSHWQWEKEENNVGWWLDSSGGVVVDGGGWESCKSLFSPVDGFSSRRHFDPRHRYRRRRWFRKRNRLERKGSVDRSEQIMFHQPDLEARKRSDSEMQRIEATGQTGDSGGRENDMLSFLDIIRFGKSEKNPLRIAVKVGDGRWSAPVLIPPSGNCNGALRVTSARWPKLCGRSNLQKHILTGVERNTAAGNFRSADLTPYLYELCYNVTVLDGSWGEVSRVLTFSPRYVIKNASSIYSIDIKQYNTDDETAVRFAMRESREWYWSDFRLPELVCIRPVVGNGTRRGQSYEFCSAWEFDDCFRWSGPIDICKLGMTAVRIRKNAAPSKSFADTRVASADDTSNEHSNQSALGLRTVRAHVEIRSGTGASGVAISFKEENTHGAGSLFRIENRSPFPLWICQNDLMVNSLSFENNAISAASSNESDHTKIGGISQRHQLLESHPTIHGDLVLPMQSVSFGLDAPFRQGKYGRIISDKDLHLIRVALAPIHSRDGIESTKVIGLTSIGNAVRLGPSKLRDNLDEDIITNLLGVRVLGVVCADGPTRVARFCLMEKEITAGNAIGDVMRRHAKHGEYYLEKVADEAGIMHGTDNEQAGKGDLSLIEWMDNEVRRMIRSSAAKVCTTRQHRLLPTEANAEYQAVLSKGIFEDRKSALQNKSALSCRRKGRTNMNTCEEDTPTNPDPDQFFYFKASFGGLLLSFVDSEPSEIAVACLRDVQVAANWNSKRSKDAIAGIRVGWIQVDNHCPSASFPVAICPDMPAKDGGSSPTSPTVKELEGPFLTIQLSFAPKHSSGIACLRSVILKPRDLAIAVDLAFLARVQRFLLGVQEHLDTSQREDGDVSNIGLQMWAFSDSKEKWPLPDLKTIFTSPLETLVSGAGKEIYFGGLTIFPCNLTLSIAPAKALTNDQAAYEGMEAAAIHAAVRKGDMLVSGGGQGVLGVKVGGRNNTAVQVIRGIFKNILFDALLRCDSAGLNFPGVALRNYFASAPQLRTYLITHYVTALRNNVPAVLGSLAAFGNPVGLMRDIGDGVSDFVSEPIKGLKKSVKELDPTHVVDGVAKGTGSLARHAVGGIADSASMITETFSKNMAVLSLDRRYAQQRDQCLERRRDGGFVEGVGSGGIKLARGVFEGVTGVVRAPIRGAERSGVEGFAKGVGKGLIGLVVKPVIGISDAATEVMIGVKGSMQEGNGPKASRHLQEMQQLRCRRAFYGEDRAIHAYKKADARALHLMSRTKLAGDQYLGHCTVGARVALFSTRQFVVLQENGKAKRVFKYEYVKDVEAREILKEGKLLWACGFALASSVGHRMLHLARQEGRVSGSDMVLCENIPCPDAATAQQLSKMIKKGVDLDHTRRRVEQIGFAKRKNVSLSINE